jgi:signal transduction histidine kinase
MGTNKALAQDAKFQFWEEKTGAIMRSPELHDRDLPRFTGEEGEPKLQSIHLPAGNRARAIGLTIHPFVLPEEVVKMKARGRVIDPKSISYTLVVARDSEHIHHTLQRLRLILTGGSLLTLALGFILIDRVIRVSLRPIDALARQVQDRAEHQLDSALDLPGALPSELSGLAENLDTLLARVAALRVRERDFIRKAAHELRTPIAGLRATTDLALSQPRDAATNAAHLATCQKTAIELGELVKRLSALSRVGQTGLPPLMGAIDVGGFLLECLGPLQPLFEGSGLRVTRDLPAGPMIAMADATLLRIIFNNLLDNASSYASTGATVRIQGEIKDGLVEIRIANPAHELPLNLERLFEPLFREDSSGSDAGTHLGIGLTLSLEAATAMGSSLHARKTAEGWIEFVLRMPRPERENSPS